jgi:hypothetical protein
MNECRGQNGRLLMSPEFRNLTIPKNEDTGDYGELPQAPITSEKQSSSRETINSVKKWLADQHLHSMVPLLCCLKVSMASPTMYSFMFPSSVLLTALQPGTTVLKCLGSHPTHKQTQCPVAKKHTFSPLLLPLSLQPALQPAQHWEAQSPTQADPGPLNSSGSRSHTLVPCVASWAAGNLLSVGSSCKQSPCSATLLA